MKNEKLKRLKKMKIAVLMGGTSAEREVSLSTGKAIIEALKRKGLKVISIDVDKDIAKKLLKEKINLAFIALHGRGGEDGTIQGLLELLGIPYTGSGVLASALALNKAQAKKVFKFHGLPVPKFQVLKKEDPAAKGEPRQRRGSRIQDLKFPLPLVIKPAREGSTIGISIIHNKRDIKKALEKAFRYDEEIIIEEYIEGKEVTVGIVGDEALPVIEIRPKDAFYTYEAKYIKGLTDFIIPARLSKRVYSQVQRIALTAYHALGCRHFARVDMIVNKKNKPYLLELNTIPGMTATSLLPQAAAKRGISFDNLVLKILEMAL
ncbi:D-alanine--D-alanine ligase [bacterium]|nr:D-alanine--D-alanine ligase [bacterium]MCG2678067.1 D-alanine--D-alanine ligase [bacterium]